MPESDAPLLADADAREEIVHNLDANLVVEAAAGTGKTTCLVGRLLDLFRRGALTGTARLAAVTFTHKAAAELRERLDRDLGIALTDDAIDASEKAALIAAAEALPDCHIGTIHSFCARLLRERPVEAGVPPDFSELDDENDALLRRQAWDEFAAELGRDSHRDLYHVFETFGLDLASLGKGFERYAEFPDVDIWPGGEAVLASLDVKTFVNALDSYRKSFQFLGPPLADAAVGNDGLLPILQLLDKRLARLPRPIDAEQAFRLACKCKKPSSKLIVQKQWKPLGLDGAEAKEMGTAYETFYHEAVKPFHDACLAAVYAAGLRAFALAGAIYNRLRRENGYLNFQDLLLRAAAMLRNYPEVRAELSERYARLLIDEVQDTDPVQAEIMFLLAGDNPARREWRLCHLRPGALFLVGDPKQSIYRFRRADILIYQEMKELIRRQGGRVLGLVSNFRSQPAVIDWVNATFLTGEEDKPPEWVAECGRFAEIDSPYGPGYIPLRAGRPATSAGGFAGVYRLEALPEDKNLKQGTYEIIRDEAARIAAFIRNAVDSKLLLPGRDGLRPARPDDFLLLTYRKKNGNVYAEALRAVGFSCQVSCGGTLADSAALAQLRRYLRALLNPDDPVQLTAALRTVFGVPDTDLYRWRKAGGRFDYRINPPAPAVPAIADAFSMLAGHHLLFGDREPVAAMGVVVDDLGLWPYACLGGEPAHAAGALGTALDILAGLRRALPTPGALLEKLEWLIDNYEKDPEPAEAAAEPAVRIMNLHKSKGLEAPVVFLTSTRDPRKRPPAFAVRRRPDGIAGAIAIYGGERDNVLLARPAGWEELAEEERLFLAAEKTRLNYVAATRAGAALIVSMYPTDKGKKWNSEFLPECRREATIPDLLPEPILPTETETTPDIIETIDGDALEAAARDRAERLATIGRPSYQVSRAKGDGQLSLFPEEVPITDVLAAEVGEVLHRLLAMGADATALERAAADLLYEFDLPGERAEELAVIAAAVKNSPLWRRAEKAAQTFREAPFSLRLGDGPDAVLQRGVIDLVFREDKGWVVVDYKSDRLRPGQDARQAAQRHIPQLAAYAAAWERLSGEKVAETGIYFLRSGEYVTTAVT